MLEATTFSSILEMKLRFEIGQKLLRSSVDRDGFLEEAGQELVWVTMEKFLQKERDWQGLWGLDQLHWSRDSKTKLGWNQGNTVHFQKQKWVSKFQWQGQEYKLISFGGVGGGLRGGGGECVQVCLWRSPCWQGRMHLETLEVSLKNFDEELCWWVFVDGFSGCARIGIWFSYRIGKNDSALEMGDLTELHSARNFARSKRDFQRRQHRSSRLRYSLAQRITGLLFSWTIISDLIGAWMLINVNWHFLIKCIANTLHWLCFINIKVGIFHHRHQWSWP